MMNVIPIITYLQVDYNQPNKKKKSIKKKQSTRQIKVWEMGKMYKSTKPILFFFPERTNMIRIHPLIEDSSFNNGIDSDPEFLGLHLQ